METPKTTTEMQANFAVDCMVIVSVIALGIYASCAVLEVDLPKMAFQTEVPSK